MLWAILVITVVDLIGGITLYLRTRTSAREAAALRVQCDLYRAEYRTLWLEERALAREMQKLATTPILVRPVESTSVEAEGDPLTVAQADRLAVEAERRRQERAFARAMGEPVEPEAPDLAGMEPVRVSDEEFSPVPHLTESVGGEDDDDQ